MERKIVTDIIDLMKQLTDEERLVVMSFFCKHCGCVQGPVRDCNCWRDE